jgi:hypothetical protein
MSEHKRKKENLPSNFRLKHIREGWYNRIIILQQLVATCDILEERGRPLFSNVIDVIQELEGPSLVTNKKLISKEQI